MNLGGIASTKNMGAALSLTPMGQAEQTGAAAAAVTSQPINQVPFGPQQHESAVFVFTGTWTAPAAQTITLALVVQHADDNGSGAPGTFAAAPADSQPQANKVLTGVAAAAPIALRYDLRISELKKFVRLVLTPSYSDASVTSAINLSMLGILGGASNVVTRTVDWTPNYKS